MEIYFDQCYAKNAESGGVMLKWKETESCVNKLQHSFALLYKCSLQSSFR